MSDSVIDLAAERRARNAAGAAVTVSATGSGVTVRVGTGRDGWAVLLDEQSVERHITAMQRALEALRFAPARSGHLPTTRPR